MAVGAGIAAAKVSDVGLTVSVIKRRLPRIGNAGGESCCLSAAHFAGIHAAVMVHPAPFDAVMPRHRGPMFRVTTGKESSCRSLS